MVRPDTRVGGGIDYLRVTVWAPVGEVCEVLARGVLERYGWSAEPLNPVDGWTVMPAGGRVSRVHNGGCLSVVEYREDVLRRDQFCSVEVKGAGCEHLGNDGVQGLLADLAGFYRARASRVDVMAHTECFGPSAVRDAVRRGDYVSRTVKPEQVVYIESAAGDTCYLGMQSKARGGLKRCGDRMLRVYDRRGPARVELQLAGEYAHGAGDWLTKSPLGEWPRLIRGLMRHYCDFVDRGADERAARCPLVPWWRGFVEDVEKLSVVGYHSGDELSPPEAVDGILARHIRKLYAAKTAYGWEWIRDRIERHAHWLEPHQYADIVTDLQRYIGTGLAGAPDHEDDVPF